MPDTNTNTGSIGELIEECEALAYRASRIHAWLDPVLRDSPAAGRAYAFKDRLKTSDDIRNKVLGRRNHEDLAQREPDYSPARVTDASGFRIVKLFNAEVPEALDQLLGLLKTSLPAGKLNGRLNDGGVREIEFHTSRRLDDPLSIYPAVKAVVERHQFALKSPIAGTSYSSVHVLVDCEVGTEGKELRATSEIQLRSVFEEAWSEISHRLRYEPAKTARATGAAPAPEDGSTSEVWLHLDALKSLTDGCAQYADLINRQIRGAAASGKDPDPPRPLDEAEKSASLFAGCGATVHQKVKDAYHQRTAASESKDATERENAFLRAVEAFQAAIDVFPENGNALLRDVLREELAFCLMFSGYGDPRNKAEQIYRELMEKSPDRVSVLLRLGQLRRDAGAYVEAAALMEKGLATAQSKPDTDPEVARQTNWLLRRDLAYIYWRLSESDPAREGAAASLQRSVELSDQAIDFAKTEAQHLNTRLNLIYYLVDLCNKLPGEECGAYEAQARSVLEYLRPKVTPENRSLKELDSLERGEVLFGDKVRAKTWAGVISQAIGQQLTKIREERGASHGVAFDALSQDERDMYLFAQEVLAS